MKGAICYRESGTKFSYVITFLDGNCILASFIIYGRELYSCIISNLLFFRSTENVFAYNILAFNWSVYWYGKWALNGCGGC